MASLSNSDNEERVKIKKEPGKYKNRDPKWSEISWNRERGKLEVEMSVKIKEGPVKYKKRGLERSQIFWNGERGKSEVEKREVQNEKRVRVNGTIEKDGAKLGADYITRSNPENEERVEIKKRAWEIQEQRPRVELNILEQRKRKT